MQRRSFLQFASLGLALLVPRTAKAQTDTPARNNWPDEDQLREVLETLRAYHRNLVGDDGVSLASIRYENDTIRILVDRSYPDHEGPCKDVLSMQVHFYWGASCGPRAAKAVSHMVDVEYSSWHGCQLSIVGGDSLPHRRMLTPMPGGEYDGSITRYELPSDSRQLLPFVMERCRLTDEYVAKIRRALQAD